MPLREHSLGMELLQIAIIISIVGHIKSFYVVCDCQQLMQGQMYDFVSKGVVTSSNG